MDPRSQTASSKLNALETLRDTLLLSEGFWAASALGHSSETLHGHRCAAATLPARAHTEATSHVNMHTHTRTHMQQTNRRMHAHSYR